MNKPTYVPVRRHTKEEILRALSSANSNDIRDALISAAYWENDWRWAQQQLINFAEHDEDLVQWAVAAGLGFLTVFNGQIDELLVRPILNRLKSSPNATVVSAAADAKADIDHFVTARKLEQKLSWHNDYPRPDLCITSSLIC